MEQMDDRAIILEEYRIYTDTKEKFIDRQFRTNNFYLVLNLVILTLICLFSAFIPEYMPIVVGSIIGASSTLMWWMNIDSYQMLIKVKYSKVLEYLETKLPEQPCQKEYIEYMDMKKKDNLIVFGDFQKILALIIACVYFIIIAYNIANLFLTYYKANG